jgi:hypothetical protein
VLQEVHQIVDMASCILLDVHEVGRQDVPYVLAAMLSGFLQVELVAPLYECWQLLCDDGPFQVAILLVLWQEVGLHCKRIVVTA